MRKNILTIGLLVSSCMVLAQKLSSDSLQLNEVVITGNRFETPVEKSGKTIYRISEREIEKSKGQTVADLINNIPGMQVDGLYGTPGSNMSYYLRGGRNRNTLVLIDGVPLNDPSSITAFYDLRYLALDQVESIEVLNGGLSTLYGSGAAAGVINIKLKDAAKETISGVVDVNAGSYKTWNEHLQVSGSVDRIGYLFSANNSNSEGISSAKDSNETGSFDKDGFDKQNGLLKLSYDINDKWDLDIVSAYDQFESEYDDGAFTDADNTLTSQEFRLGLTPSYHHSNGKIVLKALYNTNENDYKSNFPQRYNGKNWQFDLSESYIINKNFKGLIGAGLQQLSYEQIDVSSFDDNKFTVFDPYVSIVADTEFGLNVQAGVRLNTHSEYGNQLVYNINPSYLIDVNDWKVKLKGALSTSYITPSLYQIYSVYGNKDLNPEESTNYEFGVDFYLKSNFALSTVYFKREEKELIDFVSQYDDMGNWIGGLYDNVGNERVVEGAELSLNWNPRKEIGVRAYYSESEAHGNQSFYRIPNDKWGLAIALQPTDNLNATVRYAHTGDRADLDYVSFTEIYMPSFDLIDLSVDYGLMKSKFNIYGRVNNLTDENNIGVYGFNSMGRNFKLGVRYSF